MEYTRTLFKYALKNSRVATFHTELEKKLD